ncbi:hypothetical protein BOTBODRAFT_177108 [Botryobasidium botryosum FD-172 SS1]|uniref:Uncharacterized protein n=1 Tax=Botryobasidium botryosum (strain FD-172 SS1) TaxID=930990 RepID=A0A067MJH4_BOTB1|nr:hypothetical protein BOTBODRAFT_177108 [Botryobasidium botryosum FD-172 SS1]
MSSNNRNLSTMAMGTKRGAKGKGATLVKHAKQSNPTANGGISAKGKTHQSLPRGAKGKAKAQRIAASQDHQDLSDGKGSGDDYMPVDEEESEDEGGIEMVYSDEEIQEMPPPLSNGQASIRPSQANIVRPSRSFQTPSLDCQAAPSTSYHYSGVSSEIPPFALDPALANLGMPTPEAQFDPATVPTITPAPNHGPSNAPAPQPGKVVKQTLSKPALDLLLAKAGQFLATKYQHEKSMAETKLACAEAKHRSLMKKAEMLTTMDGLASRGWSKEEILHYLGLASKTPQG